MEINHRNKALELAINDFETFCKYAGVNKTQLNVCMEKKKGLTIRQISNKLNIPKSTIKDICDRCFEEKD